MCKLGQRLNLDKMLVVIGRLRWRRYLNVFPVIILFCMNLPLADHLFVDLSLAPFWVDVLDAAIFKLSLCLDDVILQVDNDFVFQAKLLVLTDESLTEAEMLQQIISRDQLLLVLAHRAAMLAFLVTLSAMLDGDSNCRPTHIKVLRLIITLILILLELLFNVFALIFDNVAFLNQLEAKFKIVTDKIHELTLDLFASFVGEY